VIAAIAITTPAMTWSSPPAAGAVLAGTSRAQADYALDNFGDPWDFSNPEDFDVTPNVQSEGVRDVAVSGGLLHGDADAGGKFEFIRSHVGMALPWGRDPGIYPLDPSRYTTISFAMTADHDAAGGVLWYTCAQILPSCQGGFSFPTKSGTHTYTYDIPSQPRFAGSLPWAGDIRGLFIVPSGGTPISVAFDWVRVMPPGADATPAAVSPPQPQFLSPSRSGGRDYASVVRGDAWDFSEASDVASATGMTYTVAGGVLDGVSTTNDPQIELPLGPTPIDGTRFHRLVFRVTYDGPFGLADAPGGGMNVRVIWQVAARPDLYQDSQDVIVYPGLHTYEIELGTNPPSDAVDETDAVRIGWAGQQITSLRFDPHEDPGPRGFVLDFIRLTEDNDSSTPIQFVDAAWQAGETVDLIAASDRSSCNGASIATGVSVLQGVTQVAWPTGLAAGSYSVCGRFHNATFESPVFATGQVLVRPSALDVGAACPPGRVLPTAFTDVGAGNVHSSNIACAVWWGIANGTAADTYAPSAVVNRGQMASFIARLVERTGGTLPPGPDQFPDDNGNPHEANINRLAAAGLVGGRADGTYGPADAVSRAQMATFVVRAYQFRSGTSLSPGADAFGDDNGNTHEANINRAATAGFVTGRADGTYSADQGVTRDQMASFITRVVAKLVLDNGVTLPA
jgi:hypothetical protein